MNCWAIWCGVFLPPRICGGTERGLIMGTDMSDANQFRLLRERRFLPFFAAQACGAFNDNLFKNVLIILVTYQATRWSAVRPELLANIAAGLFILPFVVFSGLAGQLGERFEKSRILQCVKALEIAIMIVAGIGFARRQVGLLLFALFMMGVHSTFFAPAKYGLLPEVLDAGELIGGNAMLETGTFLAILLGTLAAGVLAGHSNTTWIEASLVLVAIVGFLTSLAIPKSVAVSPGQRLDLNPWTSTLDNLHAARASRAVLLSVLGMSWFWFYGALVLVQLPLYCHNVLHGDESLVTITIVAFAVGVGGGSLLCERLSGRQVEIGLVPFGSIGLTVFAVDWFFASPHVDAAAGNAAHALLNLHGLLALHGGARTLFDITAIGVFGGFFVVPLNALVQQRSRPEALSRVIGANSILNALFMVAAALLGAVGLARGLTVLQLILLAALLNGVVAIYIYTLVPEFLLRFACWLLVHTLYRMTKRGARFPETGAALLVCNHVSFVDALVISAACRRPIRFIMDEAIFRAPIVRTLATGMKAIPIASAKEDPTILERAFEMTAAALRDGELVCIFPEGRLTRDGQIAAFRAGLTRILAETPVPVIPMAIAGLWGSMFSRRTPKIWQRLPRKLWHRVVVDVGEPAAPENAAPEKLRERVCGLYAQAESSL
jgi:1-acyl-sn-glycerol-3-phosphate acyltransferase